MNCDPRAMNVRRAMTAMAGLLVGASLIAVPVSVRAQTFSCTNVLSTSTTDSDSDGFTDYQECNGLPLFDGTRLAKCGTTTTNCLDPVGRNLFAVYAPAATGSLMGRVTRPFDPNTASTTTFYGIAFHGMSALKLNVIQLAASQVTADRLVSTSSTQRATRIVESLDTSSTILGNCQWGTPNGLDGCVAYSARTKNFVTSTCAGLTVVTPSGIVMTASDVINAYLNYLLIHENGHSLGGLTSTYNASYGGYHYMPGAGFLMEQAVTYSTKGGKCTFYISPGWNATLDPPAVKMK